MKGSSSAIPFFMPKPVPHLTLGKKTTSSSREAGKWVKVRVQATAQ